MFRSLCWAFVFSFVSSYISASEISGRVIDSATGQPIPNAIVTSGAVSTRTNAKGEFGLQSDENKVAARAYGHGRASIVIGDQHRADIAIEQTSR